MISKIHLAPMAGITDRTFRTICREFGAEGLTTEMVSAKGLYYKSEKTRDLLMLSEYEKPVSIQIFGSSPDIMAEIVPIVEEFSPSAIDINMGCPMPKIVNNGDGCALMKNPNLAGKIVQKVVLSAHVPITVKIRKGWDTDTASEFAKVLEANGASQITVHGRTREQFYSGKSDPNTIKNVKKAVKIPVIANGDIFSCQDAARILEYTSCDGIMVGRGAQGNPFIFKQICEYLKTGQSTYAPTNHEKLSLAKRHLSMLCSDKGEHRGILEARKHIAWYLKGIPNSAEIKNRVFSAKNMSDIADILESAEDISK